MRWNQTHPNIMAHKRQQPPATKLLHPQEVRIYCTSTGQGGELGERPVRLLMFTSRVEQEVNAPLFLHGCPPGAGERPTCTLSNIRPGTHGKSDTPRCPPCSPDGTSSSASLAKAPAPRRDVSAYVCHPEWCMISSTVIWPARLPGGGGRGLPHMRQKRESSMKTLPHTHACWLGSHRRSEASMGGLRTREMGTSSPSPFTSNALTCFDGSPSAMPSIWAVTVSARSTCNET